MSTRDSLLLAFVAAVVGVGAGFLVASVLQDSQPVEAAESPVGGPPSPRTSGEPKPASELVTPARGAERAPAIVSAEAPAARVPEAQLERALDSIAAPTVAAERGAGTITGEVLDASGAPLQGVVVIARRSSSSYASDPARVGAGPPEDESLEDYLRKRASDWARSRESRRQVVTGADGEFELAGLVEDKSYQVSAYLEDHVLEAEGSYSVSPGQRLVFRAQDVHVIPVQLVYADGRPVTEGLIGVERGDRETYYSWSAGSPDLRLLAGRVGVRAYTGIKGSERSSDGIDSTHGSEKISVDVVDQAGTPLELVLSARAGIRGRVTDDFGVSSGRLLVRLLQVPAGAELDESALAASDRRAYPAGDRFHFLDLAPGSYALGISNWNEALLAHQVVTVAEGVVDVVLAVPEPDPEASLVVRAFGPSGNPLQDLEFRWRRRGGGGSSSGGLQGRAAADGAYWLNPKADFFEPWEDEVSYTLTVRHSELGSREIQLEEGQREVTVTYTEPVTLVVVVAGYEGSGYEGKLEVGLAPLVPDEGDPFGAMPRRFDRGSGEGQFSAQGVARIDGLAPGDWRVSLQVKTGQYRTRTVQTVDVEALTSGERVVTMDLPAFYDLVVVAPGLAKDSRLFLRLAGEGDQRRLFAGMLDAQIDADGRAVFTDLVAGDYVLQGNGVAVSLDVTVPCGDVYLDNKEPDCLRVAIGDMEGALYKAGLRAGDLIISVDGEELGSAPNAWQLFRGEGEVPVVALRNGESLQFTMKRVSGGSDWFAKLGGMLTPASRP